MAPRRDTRGGVRKERKPWGPVLATSPFQGWPIVSLCQQVLSTRPTIDYHFTIDNTALRLVNRTGSRGI